MRYMVDPVKFDTDIEDVILKNSVTFFPTLNLLSNKYFHFCYSRNIELGVNLRITFHIKAYLGPYESSKNKWSLCLNGQIKSCLEAFPHENSL